jgi:hypothetical protein
MPLYADLPGNPNVIDQDLPRSAVWFQRIYLAEAGASALSMFTTPFQEPSACFL